MMYCKQNMLEAIIWATYQQTADADVTLVYVPAVDAEADLEETAACGSSFSCAAAAASEETAAANGR